MSNVFIVIRSAVYRHEIGGVYLTKEDAVQRALALLATEPDCHHEYHVICQPMAPTEMPARERFGTGGFADGPAVAVVRWEPRYPSKGQTATPFVEGVLS